jgi:nitrite reductase (NADH) small subunit
MMADAAVRQGTWVSVCRVDQLKVKVNVNVGVAALVGGAQAAALRLDVEQIRAVGNLDPDSRAYVLSRPIVGSRGETVLVASPMYKQPLDLRSGECLHDPAMSVPTFDVRAVFGSVQVLVQPDKETPDG